MRSFEFNNALIRQYMYGTEVMEYGILYYRAQDPKMTHEQAAENAYRYAENYCRRKCFFDRDRSEGRELRAYTLFTEKVKAGRYFCTEQRKQELDELKKELDAQKRKEDEEKLRQLKQENEHKRITALRERCNRKGLDFEKENIKQLKRYRARKVFINILTVLFGIPNILCCLCLVLTGILHGAGSSGYTFIDNSLTIIFLVWLVTGGICALLMRAERKWLPDEAYEVLKKK